MKSHKSLKMGALPAALLSLFLTMMALVTGCAGGGGGGGGGCTTAPFCGPLGGHTRGTHTVWYYPVGYTDSSVLAAALDGLPSVIFNKINWIAPSQSDGQQVATYEDEPNAPGIVADPTSATLKSDIEQAAGSLYEWPTLSTTEQTEWGKIVPSGTDPQTAFGQAYAKWLDGGNFGEPFLYSAVNAVEAGQGPQSLQQCLGMGAVFISSDQSTSRPMIGPFNYGNEIILNDYNFTVSGGLITAITYNNGNPTQLTPDEYVPVPQFFTDLVPVTAPPS